MNILNALKQLRDDIKAWVTNNLNALNAKIDEKTIPIDSELDSTSTNPVQNKAIAKEIDSINDRVGNTPVATQISQAINAQEHFSGDYNDLTNAPDITDDGSDNMVITDEAGNIIFKADADGIHTTAVSLNGEAAATEKYVDDAVANIDIPEVDFTGYATEEYVAEEIAKIPPTDLTGYATEKYVDDAIAAIPETDFTGYATEDFVGTAINTAKEELSESIVAESDEWKVVDEAGNIIFSVDATGAHTTELTLDGEAAATESYVDNAIENIEFPETDLTDYATKKYVDDAVDGVDFTGYATEGYVNTKVADLVNSAPEALNTLGELATALENHEDAYDALLETVGEKATKQELEDAKQELNESIGNINIPEVFWEKVEGESGIRLKGTTGTATGNQAISAGDDKTASDGTAYKSEASGDHAVAFGYGNTCSGRTTLAQGLYNTVSANDAVAFGQRNVVNGTQSFAAGQQNEITGRISVALGYQNKANNVNCFVAGYKNTASGSGSIAIGDTCEASGVSAVAMGYHTNASGEAAVTFGKFTKTTGAGEVAMGEYNQSTTSTDPAEQTAFSFGKGTSDAARANAFEIKKNGDVYFNGTKFNPEPTDLSDYYTKGEVDEIIENIDIPAAVEAITNDEIDEICEMTLEDFLDTLAVEEVPF